MRHAFDVLRILSQLQSQIVLLTPFTREFIILLHKSISQTGGM